MFPLPCIAGDIQLKNWALMRQRYGTTRSRLLVFNVFVFVFALRTRGALPSCVEDSAANFW
jgi:hypothetical protein